MKIAYLIQAHNNPDHLSRLIKALDHDRATFYIHIDKKTKTPFDLPKQKNIHVLQNRISVFWGGFSQVQTSLNLLQEATAKGEKYDYYVLLSGADYPIKSNHYINNFFQKLEGKECIDLYKMPLFDKTFDRLEYYYLEGNQNKLIDYIGNKINHILRLLQIKRNYPARYSHLQLFAGGQWWALTDNCVRYILEFITKNQHYVNFYRHTFCPDEMFFQTIIGNSPFSRNVINGITYTDWTGVEKPAVIKKTHIATLQNEFLPAPFGNKKRYILFTRKFTDQSDDVVDIIDKQLRIHP